MKPEGGKANDALAAAHHSTLIRALNNFAGKLPLGLLARLVADAEMFYLHNLGKKSQRLEKRSPNQPRERL